MVTAAFGAFTEGSALYTNESRSEGDVGLLTFRSTGVNGRGGASISPIGLSTLAETRRKILVKVEDFEPSTPDGCIDGDVI